jgi:hypothetical protein
MSKLYENKIGPAGLPVGIGSKGAGLPVGIGSKGNTVQVSEDGNPLDSLAIKDLDKGTYSNLYENKIGPFGLPVGIGSKGAGLPVGIGSKGNTVQVSEDGNPLDSLAIKDLDKGTYALSEEKRTVEERIAILKEEIQRQRNLKDAEDSPLMEIALHRFKAYGDPSGLNDIANRRQTRDMAEENMKYSKDMAKLQKDEADAAAMKDKENTLNKLKIIAQNAKDTLDRAKRSKGENSDEYHDALKDYNLARYEVINAVKDTGDKEQLKKYIDAYPKIASVKADPNTSEGDSLVIIVNTYKDLSTNTEKSAFDRAKELKEMGKPEDIKDEDWVTLKKEINANLKEAYKAELSAYEAYKSKLVIYDLFEKRKSALETYNKKKTKANRDVFRLIDKDLEKLKVKVDDYANKEYPKPKVVKEPKEPTEYLD